MTPEMSHRRVPGRMLCEHGAYPLECLPCLREEAAKCQKERDMALGKLDIIGRRLAGEGDDDLSVDYGGLGWEDDPVVKASAALQAFSYQNKREHDLVRHQRMELLDAGLISESEYATLASEHGAVQRLEDYDKTKDALKDLVAKLVKLFDWQDTSTLHALLHVENAVNNLRADLAADRADTALIAVQTTVEACEEVAAVYGGSPVLLLEKIRSIDPAPIVTRVLERKS